MRLEHERKGAGPPLVVLHGIGHNHRGWHPVTHRLATRHEVYAVDLPGFGRSRTLRDREPTVMHLADAVEAFMAAQGHERFHVVGNSLGGGIALELARRPCALSACAISPIGFWKTPGRVWLNFQLLLTWHFTQVMLPLVGKLARSGALRRGLLSIVAEAHGERVPPEVLAEGMRQLVFAPGFQATRRATMYETFAGGDLGCPVTVAWGDHDRLLTYRTQSRRARSALPTATHVTLLDCGHVPVYDDPDQVARVILETTARAG